MRAGALRREVTALHASAEEASKAFLARSLAAGTQAAAAPGADFRRRHGDIRGEEQRLGRLVGALRSDLESLSAEYALLERKLRQTEEMTLERGRENHGAHRGPSMVPRRSTRLSLPLGPAG